MLKWEEWTEVVVRFPMDEKSLKVAMIIVKVDCNDVVGARTKHWKAKALDLMLVPYVMRVWLCAAKRTEIWHLVYMLQIRHHTNSEIEETH